MLQNSHSNWNVASENREPSIREMVATIFKLFDNPSNTVEILCEKGTLFYEHMLKSGDSLRASTFMLLYGTKEDAERYFDGYIQRYTYKNKIFAYFAYPSLYVQTYPKAKNIKNTIPK